MGTTHKQILKEAYQNIMHEEAAEVFSDVLLRSKEYGLNNSGISKTLMNYNHLALELKDDHPDYHQAIKNALSQYVHLSFDNIKNKDISMVPRDYQKSLDGFRSIDFKKELAEHLSGFDPKEAKVVFKIIDKYQEALKLGYSLKTGGLEK